MAQAHLVGHEQQERTEPRSLAQPPETLGEGRAVGRVALPDDGHGTSVWECDGGIHGHSPVPAEADRVGDIGDGRGEAVDRCEGVEPLEEETPPLLRDGLQAEQIVNAHVLLAGEAAQAGSREAVAASRGDELRGVWYGGDQPRLLDRLDAPVDRTPRPAGDGDHLQPVEEGHRGEQS